VTIPVVVKILVTFFLIVFATSRKIHLGLAAFTGGFFLVLWCGVSFSAAWSGFIAEMLSPDLWMLVGLLAAIMMFSAAMKKAGGMEAFSSSVILLMPSRRLALAIAPMLIGTLPMPGGAILSAPLVGAMNDDGARSPETLSAANYWFRHTLELAWPLYPAFILTVSITGIRSSQLMLLNLYAVPMLFLLGLIFILPNEKSKAGMARKSRRSGEGHFASLSGLIPLAIVLAVYGLVSIFSDRLFSSFGLPAAVLALLNRYLPVFLGLAASSVYLLSKYRGKRIFSGSLTASTVRLIGVVIGIRIFSALLNSANLASTAASELASAGIPAILVIAVLPFIAGLVTGVGFGYVGLSFPIVIGLIPTVTGLPYLAGIAMAGGFGYAGMMLSPLHVCMVVTAEHFSIGLPATIRKFAVPLLVFTVVLLAYVWILTLVLQ